MGEIIQGSPEWFAVRRGKVTSSRIADVTARTKSGWGASRANVAAEIIAEILTGTTADSYTSTAMQWGKDQESEARAAYEFYRDAKIELVGFVNHPIIEMAGASPDGIVGDDGLVEIKCPNTATHIDTLISAKADTKYIKQMQWQMECTGRKWCDFVSFDPRMPEDMRLFVTRVYRDDDLTISLRKEVIEFLSEVEEKLSTLTTLYRPRETFRQSVLEAG